MYLCDDQPRVEVHTYGYAVETPHTLGGAAIRCQSVRRHATSSRHYGRTRATLRTRWLETVPSPSRRGRSHGLPHAPAQPAD